jgi:glycosyl transferase family 87
MWFYVQHVLVPYQQTDAKAHQRPRGNLSDLYPRWLGARELILNHRDPYSDSVTRDIQTGYYGRPLDSSLSGDPKDQQRFAYPIYVVFLLAPFVHLSFPIVEACFRWVLAVLVVCTVLLWLRAIRWNPAWLTTAILGLLTFSSFPVLQGLKLQQLTLVVSALISAALALIGAGHLLVAGVLLATATIKPQLVLPIAVWLFLWAFSNWKARRNLILGFASAMALLLLGAQWILPGWMGEFRTAMSAYRQYTGASGSVLAVLTNTTCGIVLSVFVMLGVGVLAWKTRHETADSELFSIATSLILAATLVVIPMTAPYNQVLLLPSIFLLLRHRRTLPSSSTVTRLGYLIGSFILFWPWIVAMVLAAGSLALPAVEIQRAWAVPLWSSLALPPITAVLIAWLLNFELRIRGNSLQC